MSSNPYLSSDVLKSTPNPHGQTVFVQEAEMHMMHAQILSRMGRYSKSLKSAKKAMRRLRKDPSLQKAQQMNEMSKSNKASQVLHEYFGLLGIYYLNTDDVDKALEQFEKAKTLNPRDTLAVNNARSVKQNKALFQRYTYVYYRLLFE